jgi:hypothetical protein
MYDYLIKDQVSALIKAGLLTKKQEKKAFSVLRRECWTDQIAIIWTIGDVHDFAEGEGKDITDEEARNVLADASHGHDANIGINWDVLGEYLPTESAGPRP